MTNHPMRRRGIPGNRPTGGRVSRSHTGAGRAAGNRPAGHSAGGYSPAGSSTDGPARQGDATGLDRRLAASDQHLLAAIRRHLDPGRGLAQILSDADPPWRAAGSGPPGLEPGLVTSRRELICAEVASRIASVRFALLDLGRGPGRERVRDLAVALASGAAANLKDLNRGLDAGELTRGDALSLLDQVDLALEQARDSQQAVVPPWHAAGPHPAADPPRTQRSWLLRSLVCGPTGTALATIAGPALIAALAAVAIALWAAGGLGAGFLLSALIEVLLGVATFAVLVTAGWAGAARAVSRRAARERRPDPGTRFEELRAELGLIRPQVDGLFDEVGGCPVPG
jgi:hypothetical protein